MLFFEDFKFIGYKYLLVHLLHLRKILKRVCTKIHPPSSKVSHNIKTIVISGIFREPGRFHI